MRGRQLQLLAPLALTLALTGITLAAPSAVARPDGGHGLGRMGPAVVRTTSVSPSAGPDFELPFPCGQSWTGTTRPSHSPSAYTVDWNAPGDLGKPALASAPGVVTATVTLTGSYGRYVVIDHGGGFSTLYAHLSRIATTVGTFVDQGDLIGYVGDSGNVTGPHLHFEERKDGAYFPPYFHRAVYRFGTTTASSNCTDRPLTGDWDGDGTSQLGVYRERATAGTFWRLTGAQSTGYTWGHPGDLPLVGDWDANGTADAGVRLMGTRTYLLRNANGTVRTNYDYGEATDIPVIGDWDGNGVSDLGVYRPRTHQFSLRRPGGTNTVVTWSATGEVPVSGDWNGDGRTDIGSWNMTTGVWTLRVPSGSSYVLRTVQYGGRGDLPITGDWNGDGVTDLGVWRTSTATVWKRMPASGGRFVHQTQVYGIAR